MPEITYDVHKFPNAVVAYVDMSGTNTAHAGDWLMYSGGIVLATNTATAYYRASGIGIALANNPTWNSQGSALYQTAMPVGIGGTFHVTGVGVGSAGDYVMPMFVGSGIVGQTGLTGRGAVWTAAGAPLGISGVSYNAIVFSGATVIGTASATAYTAVPNSGIARIVRVVSAAAGSGRWEIYLLPPFALGVIGGAPQT